ncbi:hypothetical protein [Qipengyuania flava]|uniref:hypothetical protein n=1 Tax=Qipengyuania flava TaxID=192812 RepID=UPI00321B5ED6
MSLTTIPHTQTGWTYTQSGKIVGFVMPVDDPANATHILFDDWWQALRFALMLALQNGWEFVGGPK